MIQGIINGVLAYFSSISFIREHKLSSYFLISGLISLALGGIIFGLAYAFSDNISDFLVSFYPWERGKGTISGILTVGSGISIGIVGIVLYKYLILILVSPFMSPLSAKVEEIITGTSGEAPFTITKATSDIIRGIRLSARNIIRELFYTALLLLISIIPLVGLLAGPMIFIVQSYYAGAGNYDYYLERHATVKESTIYIKKRKGYAIGNGLGFLLLLFIPILGLFIAPVLATVASTRLAASNHTLASV